MKTEIANRRLDGRAGSRKWKLAAFTLIELLVVIAIIGILAALIVGGAVLAKAKVAQHSAESQLSALVTAIDRYYRDRGYYPSDNAVNNSNYDSVESPLFYEITSVTNKPDGYSYDRVTQEKILPSVFTAMHVGGIINGQDPATVKIYFDNLKAAQHSLVTNGPDSFSVFGIPNLGPLMLNGGNPSTGRPINPFHYVKTNPTNNPSSYDLWIDVLWSGHTNRVSNWSPNPQVL